MFLRSRRYIKLLGCWLMLYKVLWVVHFVWKHRVGDLEASSGRKEKIFQVQTCIFVWL